LEDAKKVWEQYQEEGKEPTELKPDKYRKGSWFFYFSERERADGQKKGFCPS
jgi:hypothetical protein